MVCTGLDINPVMTVVARARLTPTTIRESLEPVAQEILMAAARDLPAERDTDPLRTWLRRPAVEEVRRLQHGIHQVLVADPTLELELSLSPADAVGSLPVLASFFYAALFAVGRDILKPFRASNPTWTRYPGSPFNKLSPGRLRLSELFLDRVSFLAQRLTLPNDAGIRATTITTGSVLAMDGCAIYDACFTSPPYATRVDYVRSSIAELSILGLDQTQVRALRREMTGTTVVRGIPRNGQSLASSTANSIIEKIASHKSHGSANYYAPWIRNYLTDLEHSLERVSAVVTKEGTIGILVQDSHYKREPIELQAVIIETMNGVGRSLRTREDYPVRRSLAQINSAAQLHLPTRSNFESLLIFC